MPSKSDTIVVILAGGTAVRLKPLSNIIPKPLMPIGSMPIIQCIIHNFLEAGFVKFLILLGYKGEQIRSYLTQLSDLDINYVIQEEQKGMADAVLICANYIKNNLSKKDKFAFFVSASDILIPPSQITKIYDLHQNSKSEVVLSLLKSTDPRLASGHANVEIEQPKYDNQEYDAKKGLTVHKIIEKPKKEEKISSYYSMPLYFFTNEIVKYLTKVHASARGELEIQDAIQMVINQGLLVKGLNVFTWDNITLEDISKFHLTYLKDLISLNKHYLQINIKTHSKSMLLEGVVIGRDVLLDKCVVYEDCTIGDSSNLKNSIFFKGVRIGNNVFLKNCIVIENTSIPDNYNGQNLLLMEKKDGTLEKIEIN